MVTFKSALSLPILVAVVLADEDAFEFLLALGHQLEVMLT